MKLKDILKKPPTAPAAQMGKKKLPVPPTKQPAKKGY